MIERRRHLPSQAHRWSGRSLAVALVGGAAVFGAAVGILGAYVGIAMVLVTR